MRILLADDQPKVRLALRLMLEQQEGIGEIDEAVDGDDLLALAEAEQPDLLLLDWELPGMATAELLPALLETCPDLYVITLSSHPEARPAALAAGANAFVSKTDPPDDLLRAFDLYHADGETSNAWQPALRRPSQKE